MQGYLILYILILISSYALAGSTFYLATKKLGAFPTLSKLKMLAVAAVVSPILIAWVLGLLLRLTPGHSSEVYLAAIYFLFAIFPLIFIFRHHHKFEKLTQIEFIKKNLIKNYIKLTISVLLLFVSLRYTFNSMGIPIFYNDPSEYYFVARKVLEFSRLDGVYPPTSAETSGGFYGPWTHPPGFVLSIAWTLTIHDESQLSALGKVASAYNYLSLLFLAFAWAGGFRRFAGLFAAGLVFSSDYLLGQAFQHHVDPIRLALTTAALCLTAYWFRNGTPKDSLVLGAVVGLSMFVHSIGFIFFAIFAGLLLVVRGISIKNRASNALLVLSGSIVIVWPDYANNLYNYGRLIGDSAPLWEISELKLAEFLDSQRNISTLSQKIDAGIISQLKNFPFFGFSGVAALIAFTTCFLTQAIITKANPNRLLKKFTDPNVLNVLSISCVGFISIIALSIALDMNLIVKNIRYLLTMNAAYAIVAALSVDKVARLIYFTAKLPQTRIKTEILLIALLEKSKNILNISENIYKKSKNKFLLSPPYQ